MKITAAVARATRSPLSIETLEIESPRPHEVLVRLVATGICHTDIAMRDQTYPVPQPIVLGHEGAGIVAAVGAAVRRVAVGDPVVMTYESCGVCPCCAEHAPQYCHDFFGHNFAGRRADGSSPLRAGAEPIHGNFFGQSSFATHALCTERNLVVMPRDVPLEILGPLACGIQTGAGAVINALKVGPGRSVAVFGAGSVGLSAVMAARVAGAARIVAVDLLDDRLALARDLGATDTVSGRTPDLAAEIVRLSGGGVDYAVETTARPAVIRAAMESLAPRGTCGILGASTLDTEITLNAMHLMTAGRSLRGIVEGDSNPPVFIHQLIELYRQGRFPFDRLLSFYPFEAINQAIEDAEHGRAIKPVVRFPVA